MMMTMMMLMLIGNNYDLQYRSILQFCWINDTKYKIEVDNQLLGEMMMLCAYNTFTVLSSSSTPSPLFLLVSLL